MTNQRVSASEEEGLETSLPGHYSFHTSLTSVLFTLKATENGAPLEWPLHGITNRRALDGPTKRGEWNWQ